MTTLPAKELLDGSKLPKTTTGEMKDALGKLRDYLNELLGENSADREAARLALGIDLAELTAKIDAKADAITLEETQQEMAGRGVPVGSVHYFAMTEPPGGYLKADGSAVGRQTYPELFAAIGTSFGAGDGETTFNLPDLMGRFAEGNAVPGTVREAGLPDIVATFGMDGNTSNDIGLLWDFTGAMSVSAPIGNEFGKYTISSLGSSRRVTFSAKACNPLYGASTTVQPPALTLLPCIKAFHAVVNPDMNGKI